MIDTIKLISMNNLLDIELQVAVDEKEGEEPPSLQLIQKWSEIAYQEIKAEPTELTVRIVDRKEMVELNKQFRNKNSATNVLSFAFDVDPDFGIQLLGDIVICHSVIVEEAKTQNKNLYDHYAHMVMHGVLHLCGYDHDEERSANLMESLEIKSLSHLGISNPYE